MKSPSHFCQLTWQHCILYGLPMAIVSIREANWRSPPFVQESQVNVIVEAFAECDATRHSAFFLNNWNILQSFPRKKFVFFFLRYSLCQHIHQNNTLRWGGLFIRYIWSDCFRVGGGCWVVIAFNLNKTFYDYLLASVFKEFYIAPHSLC